MEDRALDLTSSGAAVRIQSQRPHLVSLNLDDDLATGVVRARGLGISLALGLGW